MSGLPYGKFYWADWLADPNLNLCSLAAQGLWMKMLCLAAEAQQYGKVMVAGRPAVPSDLAKLSGESVETIQGLMNELERNEVYDKDRNGTIYCRRMIREVKKTKASAKGGRIGGVVTRDKKRGIFSTQDTTQEATQHPEARSQKPEARVQKPVEEERDASPCSADGSSPPPKVDLFESEVTTSPASAPVLEACVKAYNDVADELGWPKCQGLTSQRATALRQRLKSVNGLAGWQIAMGKARASPFLRGETGRDEKHLNWRPTMTWLIKEENFFKLMEGVYDQHDRNNSRGSSGTSAAAAGIAAALDRCGTA